MPACVASPAVLRASRTSMANSHTPDARKQAYRSRVSAEKEMAAAPDASEIPAPPTQETHRMAASPAEKIKRAGLAVEYRNPASE